MARRKSVTRTIKKVVVVFDICSSTIILEDLISSENLGKWKELLGELKRFLYRESKELYFDVYKFLGDGWILLFPDDVSGEELLDFLERLCADYKYLYKNKINPILSVDIHPVGITFGVDKGTLMRITMLNQTEYVGRPLNVAARLQGSIKDKDPNPQFKILMSKSVFAGFDENELKIIQNTYRVQNARRTLRNISADKDYLCKKITFYSESQNK